jgi:hypothetical protein
VLFTWLIQVCTRSRWNHTALALGPDASGVELMVEATTSRGVQVNPVASRHDELRTVHLTYQGNDEDEVLAYAAARVGVRYGFVNAFFCGLRHLFPGALVLKIGNQVICSELVAESLERAGFDWGKDSALVTPGDVARKLGVPRN